MRIAAINQELSYFLQIDVKSHSFSLRQLPEYLFLLIHAPHHPLAQRSNAKPVFSFPPNSSQFHVWTKAQREATGSEYALTDAIRNWSS